MTAEAPSTVLPSKGPSVSQFGMLTPLLPGGAQGATAILLGHPLDTLKTRMQSRPGLQRRMLRLALTMIREEGLMSLYRGVVPPLLLSATKRSVQLTLFEALLRSGSSSSALSSGGEASVLSRMSPLAIPPALVPFLSGAAAGGAGTFVSCPLHVVKIQTQDTTSAVVRNGWSCAAGIWQREGIAGFYRGWKQHAAKDICFASAYLGLYQTIRERFGDSRKKRDAAHRSAAVWQGFLAGSTASIVTWTVLFPLDSIKTRVQAKAATGVVDIFRQPRATGAGGFWVAVAGLYRGWWAAVLRAGPVNGAAMVAYEQTREWTGALQ